MNGVEPVHQTEPAPLPPPVGPLPQPPAQTSEGVCLWCIGKFSKPYAQHFCSRRCYNSNYAKLKRDKLKTTRITKCRSCGEHIINGHSNRQFCSIKCRNTEQSARDKIFRPHQPRTGIKACAVCGKNFMAYNGKWQKFCSSKCRMTTVKSTVPKAPRELFSCLWCGITFERISTMKRKQVFCSTDCRKHRVAARSTKAIVSKRCVECGGTFKISSLAHQHQRFCSHDCMYKNRNKRPEHKSALRRSRHARRAALTKVTKGMRVWETAIYKRRTQSCYLCGGIFPVRQIQEDHVAVALARGGSHTPDNVAWACAQCNNRKKARPIGKWVSPSGQTYLQI